MALWIWMDSLKVFKDYMIKNQSEVFLENKDIILFPMCEASLPHSTCSYCRGHFKAFWMMVSLLVKFHDDRAVCFTNYDYLGYARCFCKI